MGWFSKDPLQIIAFHSYGTDTHLYARGRAIEDESIDLSKKGLLRLLINSYKRFETDEVKNTKLKLTLSDGRTFYTTTDKHGYFLVDVQTNGLEALTNNEGWLPYVISYDNQPKNRSIKNNNRFPGEMLIPSNTATFGIASDIDDTILHTGVTSKLKWRLLLNTFFKRAERRSPLEGASDFYHMLHRGVSGENSNPLFYVSHSPWNLYRYLELFLKKNNFPKGPILLRRFSAIFGKKSKSEKPQKQKEIINLLQTYPKMPFILIGDSGEHDADIYIEIAQSHPDRILAIYLRSVRHHKRMMRIRGLFDSYKTTPALLVEDSQEAIEHAREHKFIR